MARGGRGHDRLPIRFKNRAHLDSSHRSTVEPVRDRLRFEVQGEIQRRGRVGECTDADAIDAGLSQRPHGGQIHAAGGFELNRGRHGVAAAHGLGHELRPEVVDQDDVGSAAERTVELLE